MVNIIETNTDAENFQNRIVKYSSWSEYKDILLLKAKDVYFTRKNATSSGYVLPQEVEIVQVNVNDSWHIEIVYKAELGNMMKRAYLLYNIKDLNWTRSK